jgi:hypothetical protein
MIAAGSLLHAFKVGCPNCGEPRDQSPNSDFFSFCCQNEKCEYRCATIVVERKTGIVLYCDARFFYENGEYKRVFPAQFDEHGNQIWPVPKEPIDEKGERS